jgi:hypothetical protein
MQPSPNGGRVGIRIVTFEMLWDAGPERYIVGTGYESLEHCHGKSKRSQSVSRGVGTEQYDYRGSRNESEQLADRRDRARGRSPSAKEIERGRKGATLIAAPVA